MDFDSFLQAATEKKEREEKEAKEIKGKISFQPISIVENEAIVSNSEETILDEKIDPEVDKDPQMVIAEISEWVKRYCSYSCVFVSLYH
jgi:hypothetical protein